MPLREYTVATTSAVYPVSVMYSDKEESTHQEGSIEVVKGED